MVAPCYNRLPWNREADMTRIAVTLASSLALTGCMTQMPESEYQTISKLVSAAGLCKREQLITADQYNSFVSFQMQRRPAQYLYDQGKLWNMVQSYSAEADAMVLTDADRSKAQIACAQVASAADEMARMSQAPGVAPQMPVYTPRNTNCITNYGYTTCSSY